MGVHQMFTHRATFLLIIFCVASRAAQETPTMEVQTRSYTTVSQGLNRDLVPFSLWSKAKRLGTWDPAAVDLTQDCADWQALAPRERDLLLRLTAQFVGGEEAVATDLLPFLQVAAAEGRVEEELFLASYLWEEAKHVDAFDRFLGEVADRPGGLDALLTPAHHQLFDALATSVEALRTNPTPRVQLEAATTYQMVVEGVLAETGYQAYYTVLESADILPGMQQIVQSIQRDEARHVAYGLYLIGRLVAEAPDERWPYVEARLQTLLPVVLQLIEQTLAPFGEDAPFGVSVDQFVAIGMGQFQKRYDRLERQRTMSQEAILYGQG